MLRTFIAVKIAPTAELRRLHARLAELGDRFRPAALGNLHVTLKFLGDTPEEQIPEICRVVKCIAERQAAGHVELSGLGAFPNQRRPSVVWVGLVGAKFIEQFADDLDRELGPLGFAAEGRPFKPHLTLLRIKSRPPEALFAMLSDEGASNFGTVEIDEVEFLQSELTPCGSKYSTLGKFALDPRNA